MMYLFIYVLISIFAFVVSLLIHHYRIIKNENIVFILLFVTSFNILICIAIMSEGGK